MTAMVATRSPERTWVVTSRDVREMGRGQGCSSGDDRVCRAVRLRRDGLDWPRIAREVGYPNGAQVRTAALRHLEDEES